jgi:hypothetical protein
MKRCFFIFPLAALLLACGCNIINPAEVIPAYVRVDSFSFEGNPGITGSNSHRISSVFAYIDNKSVGIFDLPVTFPVILDKPGKLMVTAGINYNGMSSYQVEYPFYLSDTITLNPSNGAGDTRVFTPVARYHPAVKLAYNQDFENYLSSPFVNDGSDTSIGVGAGGEALEGKFGYITLSATQDSSVNITRDGFPLPANTDLYLEVDYKSNIPVTLGLQTIVGGEVKRAYILGLNPRDTWGKVYIDLRTFASTYQGSRFQLLLRAVRTTGVSTGQVWVDNLKIVHF